MRSLYLLILSILVLASASAEALELEAVQIEEDFGTEPIYDLFLQYYYYVPCPTYSWFFSLSGQSRGDVFGEWFQFGDEPTSGGYPGDPALCYELGRIRVLDFAGYGTIYPGAFTIEFDVYCSDESGCPAGPSLWNSGPKETGFGWNYFEIEPPLDLSGCVVEPGPPPSGPRILITATHIGSEGHYPAWGVDNISTQIEQGCVMHDFGCLPALYPRPNTSFYPAIHSGYYGKDLEHCPPQWIKDPNDPTPDGTQYGFLELAWRIYILCPFHGATRPASWGSIKSLYQ